MARLGAKADIDTEFTHVPRVPWSILLAVAPPSASCHTTQCLESWHPQQSSKMQNVAEPNHCDT